MKKKEQSQKLATTKQISILDQMFSPLSQLNQNKKGANKFYNTAKHSNLKEFAKLTRNVWFHQWWPLAKKNTEEIQKYEKELNSICQNIIKKYKELEGIETGIIEDKDYISTPFDLKFSVANDVNPYEFVRDYYDVIYSDVSVHTIDKKFRNACGSDFIKFLENIEFNGGWCSSFSAPKKGDIIIDIGGGYGMFALLALKLGAKQVYVFEPNTQARNIIKRNRELNGYTQEQMPIFKYAFGDVSGSAYLYTKPGYPCSGIIRHISPDTPAYKTQHYENVEIITLDNLIHKMQTEYLESKLIKQPKIDFIKIHTNGNERLVMKGASYLLQFYEDLPDIVVNTSFSPYEYKLTKNIIDENTSDNHYEYIQRITKFHASPYI